MKKKELVRVAFEMADLMRGTNIGFSVRNVESGEVVKVDTGFATCLATCVLAMVVALADEDTDDIDVKKIMSETIEVACETYAESLGGAK